MNERAARRILVVLLTLFVGLGAAYALMTPTLEAPDEIHHYNYIRSLVNTGRPPVLEEGSGRGFGHHAPLYYAYGALVSFWVGENDLQAWSGRYNPFFGYEFGEVGRDNKNLYIHPDDDAFGKSETWLGVRVVRLASIVLGAITVWAIYRMGREVFPDHPEMAVGAAGLAAFVPEFLFISGAINDDNGAALFGALALWAMVHIIRKGSTRRRCLALGLALGMGWLSKLIVVALLPTAGLALALVAWRKRCWRELLRSGLITFTVAALLIGPWLIRQTVLYGDTDGSLVAQADGRTLGGYYPTSLWAPGEEIIDQRSINLDELPSGVYRLRVGMYLLDTGDRLPVTDGMGAPVPDDAIPLTRIHLP